MWISTVCIECGRTLTIGANRLEVSDAQAERMAREATCKRHRSPGEAMPTSVEDGYEGEDEEGYAE